MKGLNLCDGSLRTEPLLPSKQTSTCYITQVATVPWVYTETLQTRVSEGEIARAWKAVIKGAVVGWTPWSWLFIRAEHVVLLGEAHWVVEHNDYTYNRSEYMISPWCGALGLALRSKHNPAGWNSFLCITSTDAHWLETPTPSPKGRRCTVLLWIVITYNLSNPRKEVAASWSQRSIGCVSCVRNELMMSTHTYVHKTCSHTRRTSASHH